MVLRPYPLGGYSRLMVVHSDHKKICLPISFLFLNERVRFFSYPILAFNLLDSLLLFVVDVLQTPVNFRLTIPFKDGMVFILVIWSLQPPSTYISLVPEAGLEVGCKNVILIFPEYVSIYIFSCNNVFYLFQYSYKYLIEIWLDILHLLLHEQHLGKKLSAVPNGCCRLGEESSEIVAVSVL